MPRLSPRRTPPEVRAEAISDCLRLYSVNGSTVQGSIAMTSDASATCLTCNLTVYLLDNVNVNDSSDGDYAEAIQLNEAYRWQGQTPIGHALIRESTAPIPEPETYAMMFVGIGLVGFVATRRKAA